jgi:hypothetical protein
MEVSKIDFEDLLKYINDNARDYIVDYNGYSGTQLFVIASTENSRNYWITKCEYGSCSVCDTLQAIHSSNSNDDVTDQQANDYLTLALHLVQNMECISNKWDQRTGNIFKIKKDILPPLK